MEDPVRILDYVDWQAVAKRGVLPAGSVEALSLNIKELLDRLEPLVASPEAERAFGVAKMHFAKGLSVFYPLAYWPTSDMERDLYKLQ